MGRRATPATLPYDQAKTAGHKRFIGPACVLCGSTERYVSVRTCTSCHGKNTAAWSAKNKDAHRQMQADWALKNKEHVKARRKANDDHVGKYLNRKRWESENPEKVALARARSTKLAAPYARFNIAKRRACIYANAQGRPQSVKGLTRTEKDLMLSRMDDGCAYCGTTDLLTVDHKIPLSRGGHHEISNLQWLCRHHNAQKHSKTHDEYVEWCKGMGIVLSKL